MLTVPRLTACYIEGSWVIFCGGLLWGTFFVIKLSIKDHIIVVSGSLNETTSFTELAQCLKSPDVKHPDASAANAVAIDLSGLISANSKGLYRFSKFLESDETLPPLRYVRTPELVLQHFGLCPHLLRPQDDITSVCVPMLATSGKQWTHVACVGSEIPLQANYDDFELTLVLDNEQAFLDTYPDAYFEILKALHKRSLKSGGGHSA